MHNRKPKIIILVMGCDDGFFNSQFNNSVMKTYASSLPDNIETLYYYGNPWEPTRLIDGHHLRLNCPDGLESTFRKTILALHWCIKNKPDFDFIIRANTSTYLNIPLLSYFIENYAQPDVLYGSDLYSLTEGYAPSPLDIFARGNCMVMSRKTVGILLENSLPVLYLEKVDDMMIGNVLNYYHMYNGENYLDYIGGLTHGWYKSVNVESDNGHRLSTYKSLKDDSLYKSLMSCQVKSYIDRSTEEDNYRELHEIFSSIEYNDESLKEAIKVQLDYMKNPSVFIGSLIGYIDLETWKKTDKNALFNYEFSHKATDDAEHKKYLDFIEYRKRKQETL